MLSTLINIIKQIIIRSIVTDITKNKKENKDEKQ